MEVEPRESVGGFVSRRVRDVALEYCADRDEFMETLVTTMRALAEEGNFPPWQ